MSRFLIVIRASTRTAFGSDLNIRRIAGSLNHRTNNALVESFSLNSLNELTSVGRSTTNFTVAGAVQGTATSVTVNGAAASLHGDQTFAKGDMAIVDGTNTFTAVATDALSRYDTNTVTVYLPATVTLAYDLNGNLRTNGTRLFDYDDENQLISVTEPGTWKTWFAYDAKMRRRVRTEAVWAGGAWATNLLVRYMYDGNLVLQQRHYNPQLSTSIAQQTVTYTRGTDLSGSLEGAGGIGGLLARSQAEISNPQSSSHAFYHADGNGNVTCLIGTNQQVIGRYLYDPFENTLAACGPLAEANLYRFSSKEHHLASGLCYYGYRFYDPTVQRWLNRDPAGEAGGLNLFGFVLNSPLQSVDPNGHTLIAIPVPVIVIGGIITVGCMLTLQCVEAFRNLIEAIVNARDLCPPRPQKPYRVRCADQTFAKGSVAIVDGANTFAAVDTDTLNRYDANTVTAYPPATVTLAYDLNGNLRTNGTRLCDYADENKLTSVTEPGAWKRWFAYDSKLRRRVRAEAVWVGGSWATNLLVRYVYDDNLVLQERQYDSQVSTSIAQQTATYTRGSDLSGNLEGAAGIGGLLSRSQSEISNPQSESRCFYHDDGNGHITYLIGTKQTILARYPYDHYAKT